jgi:hypothetical protein
MFTYALEDQEKGKFQLMNDDSCSDAIVLVLMPCRHIGSDHCCLPA